MYKNKNKPHIESKEKYDALYSKSIEDTNNFWAEIAERITWKEKWDNISDVDYKKPHIRWFENGKLNASYNCLDRHIENGHANQTAIIWEGNNPEDDK